jgi:hypothetical protein
MVENIVNTEFLYLPCSVHLDEHEKFFVEHAILSKPSQPSSKKKNFAEVLLAPHHTTDERHQDTTQPEAHDPTPGGPTSWRPKRSGPAKHTPGRQSPMKAIDRKNGERPAAPRKMRTGIAQEIKSVSPERRMALRRAVATNPSN